MKARDVLSDSRAFYHEKNYGEDYHEKHKSETRKESRTFQPDVAS